MRVLLAAVLKAAVLYFAAQFYFHWNIVPRPFLVSRGLMQLETAVLGGLVVWLAIRWRVIKINEGSIQAS